MTAEEPFGHNQGGWPPPPGGVLAGWWYRVGATLLDNVIVGIVSLVIFAAAARVSLLGQDVGQFVLSAAYAILLIGSVRGQTVGMMAVGTRVVDATTGGPPGYARATLRVLVRIALDITIVGGLLDVLWPLWDRQNQTIHDKAANTVLLRVR
jgi:uncharacterized RDD family membrane protein YckC